MRSSKITLILLVATMLFVSAFMPVRAQDQDNLQPLTHHDFNANPRPEMYFVSNDTLRVDYQEWQWQTDLVTNANLILAEQYAKGFVRENRGEVLAHASTGTVLMMNDGSIAVVPKNARHITFLGKMVKVKKVVGAFSPFGELLAISDGKSTVTVRNAQNPEIVLLTIQTESDRIDIIKFTPDGKMLVVVGLCHGCESESTLQAFTINDGRAIYQSENVEGVEDIAFLPEVKSIATLMNPDLKVLNTTQKFLVTTFMGIRLYDLSGKFVNKPLVSGKRFSYIAVSPDGSKFAVMGRNADSDEVMIYTLKID